LTDHTLIRAQGKLVILLAAMLQSASVQSVGEFAAKLGVFAVTVGEAEPAEGEILAYWAGMVRDLAASDTVDPLTGRPFT
jgi:hypothetical protein